MLSCSVFLLYAGVLALLAVGLVSSAQELYFSQTSQDSVSMAPDHSAPLVPPQPPHPDWPQEGSSSGEWSSKGGIQLSNSILPAVEVHPSSWHRITQTPSMSLQVPPNPDTDTVTPNTVSPESQRNQPLKSSSDTANQGHMNKLVWAPQGHNPVSLSVNQASSSSKFPGTAIPNIDVESVSGAPNPLALIFSSGSDGGAAHVEPLNAKELTDPRSVPDQQLSSRSIHGDPARDGLKLREHAQGAAHHTITLREVHAVSEPPTEELSIQSEKSSDAPSQSPTSTTSTAAVPAASSIKMLNPTVIPNNSSASETTTAAYIHFVPANSTDSPLVNMWNVTAEEAPLSNSSSAEEAPAQGNRSEVLSTASRNFSNRLVPATTKDPSTPNNSSDPTVDSPQSQKSICLSNMVFVWIVVAISVLVSSCCK